MEDFQLVDPRVFEQITSGYDYEYINGQRGAHDFNYCNDCKVAMNNTNEGYECPECHIVVKMIGEMKDCSEENSSMLKISVGGNRSVYNSVHNYSKIQFKAILDQLMSLNEEYKDGPKFPKNILIATANFYNDIQKLYVDKIDENGEICGQKKFVRRSNIKDEILGYCLYCECINGGVPRRKKDISVFMKLQSNGISRGEKIMRILHNEGKINLPLNIDFEDDYIERYLESLGIINTENMTEQEIKYCGFVRELVNESERKKVGMSSVISSKIVGAIWILISHTKMQIDTNTVEECCDKIRKNTFMRFAKTVEEPRNLVKFIDIFNKYEVPHGIKGRIVKRRAN